MPEARLLFVEDNKEDRTLTLLAFEDQRLPFRVDIARDGEEAWKYLKALGEPVPLAGIILDLNIPKLSGLEVLKRLRARKALAGLPVVVLTSSDDPKDVSTADALGVSAYIIKPLDYGGLERVVARLKKIFGRPRS